MVLLSLGLFADLFRRYADFPTKLMGDDCGHMSFTAFLRFLLDFGLLGKEH